MNKTLKTKSMTLMSGMQEGIFHFRKIQIIVCSIMCHYSKPISVFAIESRLEVKF